MAMLATAGLLSATPALTPSTFSCRKRGLPGIFEVCFLNGKSHTKRSSSCSICYSFSENQKEEGESCALMEMKMPGVLRRELLYLPSILSAVLAINFGKDEIALASDFVDMPALRGKDYGKPKMRYPDYTLTESGLQFKDLRVGTGPQPKEGETVVVDWDGYTIGYYGRIFEARNKAKGGSFEGNEKDFLRIQLGSHQVIPAFEEALSSMNLGGVRRIIVPPELGYPDNDFNKQGPKPNTFSGQRALAFVLQNQNLIDKTLLFDIELLKISSK